LEKVVLGNKDLWSIVSGKWSFSQGEFKAVGIPGHFAIAGDKSWTDYAFSADIKLHGTNDKKKNWPKSYIYFRLQDEKNFYRFGVHGDLSFYDRFVFELAKCVNGEWSSFGKHYYKFSADKNKWYNFKVEAEGPKIKCYLDNVKLLEETDDEFLSGRVAMGEEDNSRITSYRNMAVENIGSARVPFSAIIIQRQLIHKDVVVNVKTSALSGYKFTDLKTRFSLTGKGSKSVARIVKVVGINKDYKGSTVFDISKMKPGNYNILAELINKKGSVIASSAYKDLKIMDFKWFNSQVGKTDELLPPWTPVDVSRNVVRVWGRAYDLSKSCLPSAINILGKEILHSPIKLKACINGKSVELLCSMPNIKQLDDAKVVLEANDKYPDFNVKTEIRVEFDGMMKYDVEIIPRGNLKISKLVLETPFEKKYTSLFYHPKHVGVIKRSSGSIPEGRTFIFYSGSFWLGNEEHGLDWFCETDENWHNKDSQKSIMIDASDEAIVSKVNFIDEPTKINKVLKYTFGFQATPVRPALKEGVRQSRIAHGIWYGMEKPGKDGVSPLEKLKQKGIKHLVYHESWTEYQNYPETFLYEKQLKSIINASHKLGLKFIPYFGYEMSNLCPEYNACGEETLRKEPLNKFTKWYYDLRGPYQNCYGVCYNSPWQDFFLQGMKHMIDKYHVDGVYLDSTVVTFGCPNMNHGCGHKDKNGKIKDTFPIFAIRETMKRLYKLFYVDRGMIVNAHNSMCTTAPCISFATSCWNGEEYNFGAFAASKKKSDFLKVLSLDTFRAVHMGKNWGIEHEFLVSPEKIWTIDNGLAIALIHDVTVRPCGYLDKIKYLQRIWDVMNDFGVDEKDCRWFPYWKNKEYIQISAKNVPASIHSRGTKGSLLIISNLTDYKKKIVAKLDLEALGLKGKKIKAIDAITGKNIKLSNIGAINLQIDDFNWKMVLIK